MTNTELDRWMRDYKWRLGLKLRRDRFDRRLEAISTMAREIRRTEENIAVLLAKSRAKSSHRTFADLEKWQRIATWDVTKPGTEADVRQWQRHVAKLAGQHQIVVHYEAGIRNSNGYANTGRSKWVEITPIHNAIGYTIALHELGHCIRPCAPTHRRVTVDKTRTVCVGGCELGSWRWVLANALIWTPDMHGMMCHALSTYATYATPAEKREIDELISPWSYYTTRQRCAKGGM